MVRMCRGHLSAFSIQEACPPAGTAMHAGVHGAHASVKDIDGTSCFRGPLCESRCDRGLSLSRCILPVTTRVFSLSRCRIAIGTLRNGRPRQERDCRKQHLHPGNRQPAPAPCPPTSESRSEHGNSPVRASSFLGCYPRLP